MNRNLTKYLESSLKLYKADLQKDDPIFKISIDENGKILNVKLLKGINPQADSLLITSLKTAPNFTPAKLNNTPVKLTFNTFISLFMDDINNLDIIVAPNKYINIGNGALAIDNR